MTMVMSHTARFLHLSNLKFSPGAGDDPFVKTKDVITDVVNKLYERLRQDMPQFFLR